MVDHGRWPWSNMIDGTWWLLMAMTGLRTKPLFRVPNGRVWAQGDAAPRKQPVLLSGSWGSSVSAVSRRPWSLGYTIYVTSCDIPVFFDLKYSTIFVWKKQLQHSSNINWNGQPLRTEVEILLYDISKGMAAKLGPLLLGKSAEAQR